MITQRFETVKVDIMMRRYKEISQETYSTLRVLHAAYGPNKFVVIMALARLTHRGEIGADVADECWEALIK